MGGIAVRSDAWQEVLERVDVVISSKGAPHAIVQRVDVEKARRARKYRPLFFIDIDTLEQLAEEARGRRQLQIDQCERIILSELAKSKLLGI